MYNKDTGRPEIDIAKYNYKIHELESLRREAMKECLAIEQDQDENQMELAKVNDIEVLEEYRKQKELEYKAKRMLMK